MYHVPQILGIVNASPESFAGNSVAASETAALVKAMLDDGANAFDIGAQSLRTDRAEISVAEEIDRLIPILDVVVDSAPEVPVSVDTYRAPVARRAITHGASIVNDPSGLMDDAMIEVVVESGADLVVTYNIARPKHRLGSGDLAEDVVGDCFRFTEETFESLQARGVERSRIIFDPGVDLGKSPAQSVEILRNMTDLRDKLGLERVLWALSRKDFVGALVRGTPKRRDAGTLAALSYPDYRSGDLVRVHDVRGVRDFFTVRAGLENGVPGDLELPVELRHEPTAQI